MKKIKTTKKLSLHADTLRMLEANELRAAAGGVTDSVILRCVNRPTAASTGGACCA